MTSLAQPARYAVAHTTRVERALLVVAQRLETLALRRIARRAAAAEAFRAHDAVTERQRDVGAAVHHGLLPR